MRKVALVICLLSDYFESVVTTCEGGQQVHSHSSYVVMPCHSHFPQTFFSLCHVAQRLQQGQCFLCNVYPANGLWESHPPCAEETARQASLNDNL